MDARRGLDHAKATTRRRKDSMAARAGVSRKRERLPRSESPAGSQPSWNGWASIAVAIGLASVALGVPLAVLPSAAGPYDDPKVWALTTLVAATAVAWLIRTQRPPRPASDRPERILRRLVFAAIAWWAIATAASIAPRQSLQGGFGRGMGLLTIAAAALLFFIVRSECRTPRSVRSLVDVTLLGSVPVCLLALGQALGWDPLPKPWDPMLASMTVRSTFGSHIFLGGYLVVLIPLTIARLEWAVRQRPDSRQWATGTREVRAIGAVPWVAGAVALIGLAHHWP